MHDSDPAPTNSPLRHDQPEDHPTRSTNVTAPARLVQDDASGLRARAVDAAASFLAEHQAVFDEAEEAQQTPRGARAA
ncbi:hypothetical protein ACFYQT_40725 [Streptomyces tibetensis]|uniref:Uncharacterized protein n=1 Tax=Streptomyces tibetensis TaxID=2382123 RepID=A0ABW6N993_9ACTN